MIVKEARTAQEIMAEARILVRCCPTCKGFGYVIWHESPLDGTGDGDEVRCDVCHGYGVVDEDGEPFEREDYDD